MLYYYGDINTSNKVNFAKGIENEEVNYRHSDFMVIQSWVCNQHKTPLIMNVKKRPTIMVST